MADNNRRVKIASPKKTPRRTDPPPSTRSINKIEEKRDKTCEKENFHSFIRGEKEIKEREREDDD